MKKGNIVHIQKFCINDGPGIRTTVFLKGCPLNCLWCHNPESKAAFPEIAFYPEKCYACGQCAAVCPNGCHRIEDGMHLFERAGCIKCGQCLTARCGALEQIGKEASVSEVMDEVMKDKVFYDESGGGLTVSGGEPMLQFDFVNELFQTAKKKGLHTCMETSGYAKQEKVRQIARVTDLFLFDYKETSPERHRKFTGVSNEKILRNLSLLDALKTNIVLRCPIIPGCNDREEHFKGIAETANRFTSISEIQIEPYHPLGAAKSMQIGKTYDLPDIGFVEDSQVGEWIDMIAKNTNVPVGKA